MAGIELPVRWLLAEWPADQDEYVQFWLSNLPENTPLPILVRTAKLRWRIENDYREMKPALGLAHALSVSSATVVASTKDLPGEGPLRADDSDASRARPDRCHGRGPWL